jgi:type I restriction enzyme S subunit
MMSGKMYRFRTDADEIDSKYLEAFINSPDAQDEINEMKTGISDSGLNLTHGRFKKLMVPYPPIDEQQRIVAEIEKQFTRLDAGVDGLKRVQANLKRYRAAVLKAACSGQLVPTEAELSKGRDASPQVSALSHRPGQAKGRDASPQASALSHRSGSAAGSESQPYPFETGEQLLDRILTERRKAHEEQQATATRKKKYKEPATPDLADLPDLPNGWAWCISDVVFSFITSGSRGWAKYYSEEGSLFLRIGNLEHENIRLDLSKLQYVTPPIGAEGMRTVVQENDILISITADVGMVGLVPNGLGEAYINQHVALARPVSLVNSSYIAYYLCASEGGWGLFKKRQRGATKAGLGLDDIRSIPVPLPPLAEQKRIVEEVERRLSVIEEMETAIAANLKRASRLRQSILKKAFEGKLIKGKS